MDGICRADVSEPWCTLIRLKRCSIIGAVHRAARRPGQKREQEEAATWAFGAVLGLRSVRFTVPRMSGAYIAKPSAKLFVCAAQSHPLSSCDWLASDNRMRGGARHRLTDTHSLYVRGKNRENGPDSEWWEVGTFVTVASLSLSLSLQQLATPNCGPAGERRPDLFRYKSENCVGIPIAPDNMIYWILLPGVSRRGRGEIKNWNLHEYCNVKLG